jgi:ATP-binding cassette subfamily C (CFTR/MRP) protein 4
VYKTYLLLVAKFMLSALVLNAAYYVLAISSRWLGMQIKIEIIFFLPTSLEGLSHPLKLTTPRGMHEIVKLVTVLKRIENILRTVDAHSPLKHNNDNVLSAKIITTDLNVHLKEKKMLHNVNLKLEKGLTVLTGSTGSGKSLLLQVMLQEYQQPWLFPSTIKQKILFGENYDEERYQYSRCVGFLVWQR